MFHKNPSKIKNLLNYSSSTKITQNHKSIFKEKVNDKRPDETLPLLDLILLGHLPDTIGKKTDDTNEEDEYRLTH